LQLWYQKATFIFGERCFGETSFACKKVRELFYNEKKVQTCLLFLGCVKKTFIKNEVFYKNVF